MSRNKFRTASLFPALLLMLSAGSTRAGIAQATPETNGNGDARLVPVAISRASGTITLDGIVNEPVWESIAPIPMSMFSPVYLGPLTERTEVRITYDEKYFYVSGRLYDSSPGEIRSNTFYRDAYSGDDLLAVVLDSYNDYETAVWFITNPAGTRNDRSVSNDAVFSTGMPMNSDWNAHWEVATSQDSTGWSAEFRIPFSTLRFQTVDDKVTMGLIVYRFIARKNERQTFPAIDPKWGGLAFAKPSQSQRVMLNNVRQTKPVYVTPYTSGGFRRVPTLNEAGDRWLTGSSRSGEWGVDVRYSPTSNLALDFTVNTDFAQVEADDQLINLTRFPLFFPEKRQFFQERASTFEFGTGGFVDRLFHSRRIGLGDGEIVPIHGGARAVGRVGGMDFGLLNMQTAAAGGRSSENMGVLRLNQQVLNPYSSIGAMVTSRLGASGENVAYGLDAVVRPIGDEWITLKWAQSFDDAIDEQSALSSGSLLAHWERVRDAGLSWSATFSRVGAQYEPGLGFQSRRDFRMAGGALQYKRFLSAESPLRAAAVNVNSQHFFRNADGRAESRGWEPSVHFEFKGGTEVSVSARSSFESVPEAFDVAGATIEAGDYWYQEAQLQLTRPRSSRFRGDFGVGGGSFYDGTRVGLSLGPSWNPSKYLELGGGYELNRLEFNDRQQEVTTQLFRLKAAVALNTRISLNTFGQYDNVTDHARLNARFRYHFGEGTDLWLVYDEGLNTERMVAGAPLLPRSSGRTFLVKYTRTLTL
ncbi:MAG: DUF5916 domain-containing protein [Gemmatimonadota bacterium]